jgi:hypothetical protein
MPGVVHHPGSQLRPCSSCLCIVGLAPDSSLPVPVEFGYSVDGRAEER